MCTYVIHSHVHSQLSFCLPCLPVRRCARPVAWTMDSYQKVPGSTPLPKRQINYRKYVLSLSYCVYLSIFLSVHIPSIQEQLYLCLSLLHFVSVYLAIFLSIPMFSICPSVHLSLYQSVNPYIHLSVRLSINIPVIFSILQFISQYAYQSFWLSISAKH